MRRFEDIRDVDGFGSFGFLWLLVGLSCLGFFCIFSIVVFWILF